MTPQTSFQGLLLNPRLAGEVAQLQKLAWQKFATFEPELFLNGAVGISTSGSSRGAGAIGSIVVLSREALEVSAAAVNRRLQANQADIWGLALPLFHVGGFSIPIRAGLSHSRVAAFTSRTGEPLEWNPIDFHRWLSNEKVTLLSLVPTQLFDLVEAGLKSPSNLRAIVVGGGRLDETLHVKARTLGWPILQSYGLTECCSQVATALPQSDGRDLLTLDHVEVRAGDDQKLWIRSKSLLSARIVFDDDRQPRLERPVKSDGWFETSDRADVHGLGGDQASHFKLRVLGREGETVKVLGELVDLVRVRSALEELAATGAHPLLRQRTWVVAIPDARKEHKLVFVVERKRHSSEEVLRQAEEFISKQRSSNSKLAPFEIPTEILVVDEIPRSSLGKVLSTLLTEEAVNRFVKKP